jgi:hypothetical protein
MKNQPKKNKANSSDIYQLKIVLSDSHPPIWRRLVVPGSIKLSQLHQIFQETMGWTNSHLHDFLIEKKRYSDPDPEFDSGPVYSEYTHRLSDAAPKKGITFSYDYDPGDGWEHEVLVEDISPAVKTIKHATCLDGERACPPEDCGGMGGYEELLETLKGPDNEERRELENWLDEEFDPESFSLADINKILSGMKL